MTGWYDPSVLARTAAMLFTANLFGRHSDHRLIEALGSQPQDVCDYRDRDGDLWIDYVADLGDGWNPTCAIAQAIATPDLHGTRPGQVLVMGGDLVYPYPTRDAYAWHTEAPYREAFARHNHRPDLYAIPGDHDWYDSLIAFSRSFCRPERGFAGCVTRQTRSYFALALPHDWWLLGIDLQLGADFDEPQVRYFQQVARRMNAAARVILCVPEPHWFYERTYARYGPYQARALDYFAREVIARPVLLTLTGDQHHYRRHTSADGQQRVVAGGGGAFLHPTHQPRVQTLRDGSVEQVCYPGRATSARLAWRNLLFPFINPQATWLPALAYALSAWFLSANLSAADFDSPARTLGAALAAAVREPVCGLWLLFIVSALLFFTDTHVRAYRLIAGGAHAVAHLFAVLLLGWLAVRVTLLLPGLAFGQPLQLLLAGLLVFAAGGLVGGLIIGLYLLLSVNVFGRHGNEAFSSLRIQDYKHWLRLRIGADGGLTVWALGIDRVPRRWRTGIDGAPVADDARASAPRIVDRFSV
jgi:hypothetical protein